jgi:hypothetical protein
VPQKKYPLPGDGIKVHGDRIYYKDLLFAELRYFGIREKGNYHGLSIYYRIYNKEVWIYPEAGWHLYVREDGITYTYIPEIKERINRYVRAKGFINFQDVTLTRGDVDINDIKVVPRVIDVQISEDGKYVHYRIPDIEKDSLKKYDVEYGVIESVK